MSEYGIPIKYSGVQFRSRLEASWAAFFDLVGWKWTYEPVDLPGWIPDFALEGYRRVLVEVKPFPPDSKPVDVMDEVDRLGLRQEVLLVGDGLYIGEGTAWADELTFVGWLGEYHGAEFESAADDGKLWWERAPLCTYDGANCEHHRGNNACTPAGVTGFCHEMGSYHDRMSGHYIGGHIYEVEPDKAEALWKEARNLVQWKGK